MSIGKNYVSLPFIQDLILYGVKVFYDFYEDESLEDVFAAIVLKNLIFKMKLYVSILKSLSLWMNMVYWNRLSP